MKGDTQTIKEIYSAWKSHPRKSKKRGEIVHEWSVLLGIVESTLYRKFQKWESQERVHTKTSLSYRSDKGKNRQGYSQKEFESYVKNISSIQRLTMSETGACSTETAIEIALQMGLIPEKFSPSTVNPWLRRLKISIKHFTTPERAVKMKAKYANHVWVGDGSTSNQVFKRNRDGKIIWAPEIGRDKNHMGRQLKEKNLSKIWFFVLVDMFSGAFYLEYFETPGENNIVWRQFLTNAFLQKRNPQEYPLCGIPEIIYTDKTSGLKAKINQNWFEHLGVEVITHFPGHSRAKALAEARIGAHKRTFERKLSLIPAASAAELNERFYKFSLRRQNEIEKSGLYKGESRFSRWRHIKPEQLRLPTEEQLKETAYERDWRVLTVYHTIKWKGKEFIIPDDLILKGTKLEVIENWEGVHARTVDGHIYRNLEEYTEDKIRIFDGKPYRHPDNVGRANRREIEELSKKVKETIKPEHLEVDAPNVVSFPNQATPAEVDTPPVSRQNYDSITAAITALAHQSRYPFGTLPIEIRDQITSTFDMFINKGKPIPAALVEEFADIALEHMKKIEQEVSQ